MPSMAAPAESMSEINSSTSDSIEPLAEFMIAR
jgi:hypothetical protein